jgi:hypothetical protein
MIEINLNNKPLKKQWYFNPLARRVERKVKRATVLQDHYLIPITRRKAQELAYNFPVTDR